MGSFDVGCGISNLAIHEYNEVGFVIIDKPKSYKEYVADTGPEPGTAMIVYNTDIYRPMFPPVFATYADYGQVKDVQDSLNVKLLEDYFRRPAAVVINAINEERGIYDAHGSIYPAYAAGDTLIHQYGVSFEDSLVSLGFIKVPKADEGIHYSDFYDFEKFRLMHSKTKSTFDIVNMETGRTIYDGILVHSSSDLPTVMNIFGETTGIYPGFKKEEYEAIRTLGKVSGMFFLKEVYDGMEKYTTTGSRMEYLHKRYNARWGKFIDVIGKTEGWTVDGSYPDFYNYELVEFLRKDTVMPKSVIETLGIYKDSPDDFLKMHYLLTMMMQVNRVLMPSFCGEQHGNDEASLKLNRVMGKILKARKEDY